MYDRLRTWDVPAGSASVSVKLDEDGTMTQAVRVAGSVGIEATSSGGAADGEKRTGVGFFCSH